MPTNLTGNPASFPTQTAPVGGDPRTSSSVATPLQNAADRSEFLNDRLLHIDPLKEGVRRFRSFASVAALKATTDHVDNTLAYIDQFGVFVYDSASVIANDDVNLIQPASLPAAGRWVRTDRDQQGIALGAPGPLTSSSKVPDSQIRRPIVSFGGTAGGFDVTNATPASTSATVFGSLFSTSVSLTAGLPTMVFGQITARDDANNASNAISFKLRVTRPSLAATDLVAYGMPGSHPGNNAPHGDFTVCFTPSETGLHTMDLQWRTLLGDPVTSFYRGIQVIQFGAA